MKHIRLSRGEVVTVDDKDFAALDTCKWYCDKYGYAVRRGPSPNRQNMLMHRVILCVLNNPEILVDHINGDKLDNRRSNLRTCTKAENMRNRGKQVNNTSGFKGVTWCSQSNKWKAQCKTNGKRKSIGLFDSAELAHEAYKRHIAVYHGEFHHV